MPSVIVEEETKTPATGGKKPKKSARKGSVSGKGTPSESEEVKSPIGKGRRESTKKVSIKEDSADTALKVKIATDESPTKEPATPTKEPATPTLKK